MRYTKKLRMRCVARSTVTPMVRHQSNQFRRNDAPLPIADAIQPTPKPPNATDEAAPDEPIALLRPNHGPIAARHASIDPSPTPSPTLLAAPLAFDAVRAANLIDASCAATGPNADAHRRVEYGPMATAIGAHTAAVQLLASLAADESCAKTGPNIRD